MSLPYHGPRLFAGRDIIGLAETGSGKTGAFALPILQALLETPSRLFALILTPTRQASDRISMIRLHIISPAEFDTFVKGEHIICHVYMNMCYYSPPSPFFGGGSWIPPISNPDVYVVSLGSVSLT